MVMTYTNPGDLFVGNDLTVGNDLVVSGAAQVDLLRVSQTSATPDNPRIGEVRLANGTSWSPGAEGALYWFDGTAWQPIGTSLGNAGYGWRDLLGSISIRGNPANSPTWAAYRGGIYQLQFGNGTKEVQINFHIDHDFLTSADAAKIGVTPELHLHAHWSQNVVDTGGAASAPGDVKWYFEVSYAKGHQQAAFIAPVTASVVQTASGTQYQHMIAEVQIAAQSPSASQLDYDDLEVDGIIMVRCYRTSTDAADTLDQSPFLHFCDMHYMVGGRYATRNKSPDFYTDA